MLTQESHENLSIFSFILFNVNWIDWEVLAWIDRREKLPNWKKETEPNWCSVVTMKRLIESLSSIGHNNNVTLELLTTLLLTLILNYWRVSTVNLSFLHFFLCVFFFFLFSIPNSLCCFFHFHWFVPSQFPFSNPKSHTFILNIDIHINNGINVYINTNINNHNNKEWCSHHNIFGCWNNIKINNIKMMSCHQHDDSHY